MDEMTKTYKLRTPTLDDVFPMAEVLNKIGYEEIEKCFSQENRKTIIDELTGESKEITVNTVGEKIGLKIFGIILRNLSCCKDELYQLLSQLSGLTKQEVGAIPLPTLFKMIKELVTGETFKDFFTGAAELTK